jgi:hypothetical protein
MTIERSRDDSAIEETESVVVFGARSKRCDGDLTVSVATQVKAVRIGMAASEAGEVGIQRFLNAQCLRFCDQLSHLNLSSQKG